MTYEFTNCVFCLPQTDMSKNISSALFQKYSSSIHFYFISHINKLTQQHHSNSLVNYQEMMLYSQDNQYLKRQYELQEYQGKITHLSEYYKFNRELPKCIDRNIQKIIERYHEKIRIYDFKKVKAAIKRQQGISITQQHNQSSSIISGEEPLKSRYSTVLNGLNQESCNQSIILNHICESINHAFKDTKPNSHFKGFFEENSKKFQEFIHKENQKQKLINQIKKSHNNNLLNQIKNKQNTFKNNINFIKRKSTSKNNKKSIDKLDKMMTNLTNSVEQRNKKQKNDKKIQLYKPINSQAVLGLKTNNNLKTIDQIYKASFNYNDKFQSVKGKKKYDGFHKNKDKKTKPDSKSLRSPSMAKEKQDNERNQTERMNRDQSKKMIKKSSSKRISEFKTKKTSVEKLKSTSKSVKILSKQKSRSNLLSTEKNLSISKSKASLSKQPSRQSLHSRQVSARSHSNLVQSLNKKAQVIQKPHQINHMDKLLSKKLAIFIKT